MLKLSKIVAVCALTLSAGASNAAVINFDNAANGTLLNTAYSGMGVSFSSEAAVRVGGGGVTSQPNFAVGSLANFTSSLEVIFDNYGTSIGALNVSGSSFTLSAFDINGLLLGSTSVSEFGGPAFLSNIGQIKTARFSTDYQYGIDDLSFEAVAATDVPEPASMALVGLGLLGFAASRRKRGNKQA